MIDKNLYDFIVTLMVFMIKDYIPKSKFKLKEMVKEIALKEDENISESTIDEIVDKLYSMVNFEDHLNE